MFTLVAYQALSGAAAFTDQDMTLINDPSVTNLNGHPVFPAPFQVQGAWIGGTTVTRGRLSSPRLRPIARPLIHPVDPLNANTIATVPNPTEWWRKPLMINPVEELAVLVTKTSAVAEQDAAVLWVGDSQRNVPPGDMYVVRGTLTTATTLLQWNPGAVTLDDTLQVGRYSIIGMQAINLTGIAARLIFPATVQSAPYPWARPGILTQLNDTTTPPPWWRYGMNGEFGQFESFALPQVEVVGIVAIAATTQAFLDIVDVRVGARA